MCKRAARGGGLHWGVAEDAARGARWASSFGLPGPMSLAARLERLDGEDIAGLTPSLSAEPWIANGSRLCPLAAGAALSDRAALLAERGSITMQGVCCPLLVVPFAYDAAVLLDRPVSVEWAGVTLTVDGLRLHVDGPREHLGDEDCERLRCRIVATMPEPAVSPDFRGQVDDDAWRRLSELAARTLAPATEASRRLGAGSGTDDD